MLLGIPLLSFFNGTIISMGTNARMLWAFSRDRGQSRDTSLSMRLLCIMPHTLIHLEITLRPFPWHSCRICWLKQAIALPVPLRSWSMSATNKEALGRFHEH